MEYVGRAFGAATEATVSAGFGSGFGSSGSGSGSSSRILPIIAAIVALTLIVMIVIVIIQMRRGNPTHLLKGPIDLFKPVSPVVVDRATTKRDMSATYTLAFYLRIDAVPDMRASTPLFTWPGVWDLNYDAAQEELTWKTAAADTLTLPAVPSQRWTQIVIALEGRTFDLYINGKLIKTHTLTNLPPIATSSITIVPGGIIGQIAYVQLWPRRLTVRDVNNNYLDTSDSQGRPFLGPAFFGALKDIRLPNLFCPSGDCTGSKPTATPSQTWEFPYA